MTTITIPRETFDQMREALMSNVKALDAVYQAVNDGYLEDKVLMPAIKASEAAISAAKAVQPQAQGEDKLRETVATVLEGWTIPDAVRKMLETAYWSHPQASEPAWLPIETAPKDGTVFLGLHGYKVREAYRVQRDDCEMWCFGGASGDVEIAPWTKPTHWMPLPAAPEATK